MSSGESNPPEGGASEGEPVRGVPGLIHNRLSLVGEAIAALVVANLLFLFLLSSLGIQQNPYVGILAYLIFPLVALFALLLIPIGMLFERRRRRKQLPGEIPRYPRIDLNTITGRRLLTAIVGFSLFFIAVTTAASYQAYHFTDTVTFCGAVCHTPMKPEYTAYQDSPHARVPCVSCHVGPGAAWYVRSKLTGAYQVYAVLFDVYPRPITTPIKSLRPVREACEQCHWPKKFYGAQLKVFTHFAYDNDNTPTQIQMLIKTGGGAAAFGQATGIHWHMNIANKVWFVATDKHNQDIPWVKVLTREGRVTVYTEKGTKLTAKQIAAMPKHLMDCVTCHDRPSHKFRPPDQAVDEAFMAGKLDPSLPYLKKEAVTMLTSSYPSTETALEGIATGLDAYYHNNYPQVYEAKQTQIKEAIATVQLIYSNNIFPYMKVSWRTHPDNIGHLYYRGCFRCHDGKHVSADGRLITQDCDTCHTILGEKISGKLMTTMPGKPFKHPIDLSALKGIACNTCHTGAAL
jgi:NapC/NirT cytochrome c family, N-terminal region